MTEVGKHSPVNNHETIDELDEESAALNADGPSWMERARKLAVRVSSTWPGQFAIRQCDRLLWTVEKTAKWSCPVDKGEYHRHRRTHHTRIRF